MALYLKQKIPGIHSSRLNLGMLFSSQSWHVEDQMMYSMTYMHSGTKKRWYCIPSYAASMFERVVESIHPDYTESFQWESPVDPGIMVPPAVLLDRGVPLYSCTQEPGSIVVSYPNSYNCCVDLSLNMSESIQLMPPDWLRYAGQAASLYRNHRYPPLFSSEKLVLDVTKNCDSASNETKFYVVHELSRILEEESILRFKVWAEGLHFSRQIKTDEASVKKENGVTAKSDEVKMIKECCVCRNKLFLSMIECKCTKSVACLHHRQGLCNCSISRQRLAWRYSLLELGELIKNVQASLRTRAIKPMEEYEAELEADLKTNVTNTLAMAKTLEEKRRESLMAEALGSKPKSMKRCNGIELKGVSNENSSGDDIAFLHPGAPMTFITQCGYVQGPLRKFSLLDIHPEDVKDISRWESEMAKNCMNWINRAERTLLEGGDKADDLPDLVDEGEQYLWGGVDSTLTSRVEALYPKLIKADRYIESLIDALDNRPTLSEAETLIATDPLPIQSPPGLEELRQSIKDAKEWQEKYNYLSDRTGEPMDSKALDIIAAEAARIPITLDEARLLKERLAKIKKVAESIRAGLPSTRDAGRRKKDDEVLSIEDLERLDAEAKEAHIMMPEIANLQYAMGKVNGWRAMVDQKLEDKTSIEQIDNLIEEGRNLPCHMPYIEQLEDVKFKVHEWIVYAESLRKQEYPVRKVSTMLFSTSPCVIA